MIFKIFLLLFLLFLKYGEEFSFVNYERTSKRPTSQHSLLDLRGDWIGVFWEGAKGEGKAKWKIICTQTRAL